MYTLDANIFVRDLDTREPQHAECHALLDELQAQALPIIVPVLVLAEVAGTVSRTRRDPIAGRLGADLLRGIGSLSLIPIDDTLAQAVAELAADYALRGADAVYVAVARRHNCTLVSLDRLALASALALSSPPARPLRRLPTSNHRRQCQARDWEHVIRFWPAVITLPAASDLRSLP